MGDGLLGKCKDCTKLDVRIDRVTNPRVRERERARANLPQRVASREVTTRRWQALHPEWRKAQYAAGNAQRDGKLIAPVLCEGCGLPARLQKHHHDYSRPLLVMWLCKPCHAIADKLRRLLEAS